MCVCTPSIPEWYCGQGDCIWPDERKPGHAAPVKKESEATEMSGETELKPCPNPNCDKSKGLLSRNTVIRGERIPEHVVSCITCGMSGPACSGPYQAMDGWNRLPRATPPGYELVPEGTEAKNPNLLFYEYETDLLLAAKALESSMPNAAGRVRWLASLLAKTKPQNETPNAQG